MRSKTGSKKYTSKNETIYKTEVKQLSLPAKLLVNIILKIAEYPKK